MSTIRANTIQDASGGSAAVLYGVASPPNSMGFRNRIINGDMRISQRGITISSGINTLTYTLDRWTIAAAGAAVSVSASSDPTSPYTSYMGITGAAGNTIVGIRQRIEWLNTADLAGQSVTVSFYCYNATGNATSATVQLNYPTAKDNYTSTTSSATQTITLSNTGRQSFTFTVPAAAANGIELNIFAYALTSGVLVLREVQLEAGTVASPFEARDYGRELMMCQRYYETAFFNFTGYTTSGSGYGQRHPFKVNKRASPTMTTSGVSSTNASSLGLSANDTSSFTNNAFATATGVVVYSGTFIASIEL